MKKKSTEHKAPLIAVLGAGKSAVAAANLAIKLGADVLLSDINSAREIKNLSKKVSTEFGGHSDKVLDCDFIVKSPGIHSDIAIIKKARRKKIEVISELKFALNCSKHKKILAVSGTNGKTTTTDLLSKIIKSTFKDSIVCGNIGFPLSDKALKTSAKTFITLEVSSYQLEDTWDFKPDISVLLNIAQDHLEHHKTMVNYVKAKKIIFENQDERDFAVLNFEDEIVRKISAGAKAEKIFFSKKPPIASKVRGDGLVFYEGGEIVFEMGSKTLKIKPRVRLPGLHNIENILAAAAAAFCAGVSLSKIERTISAYKGMPHRLEFVARAGGADYYNDSKATNVDSTRVALEAFGGNILLIMGGQDKGFPYTPLRDLIKAKVKAILLVGEAAVAIRKDLEGAAVFYECGTIEGAVGTAAKLAGRGDIVLLSPACASWDQFKSFEERGEVFRREVLGL